MKYLAHYGVKGQKKGERRYQNYDGSLTPLGREHYGVGQERRKKQRKSDDGFKKIAKAVGSSAAVGLAGGLATGVAIYGLAAVNPALIGSATATVIGRTAVIAAVNSMFQTTIREVASYENTKHGEQYVNSQMRRKNQNPDGSLTDAGKARYGKDPDASENGGKEEQSSGRYPHGSKEPKVRYPIPNSEKKMRDTFEIMESDKKNWKKETFGKNDFGYEYIGPEGSDKSRAKAFRSAGYTYAEIADFLDISMSSAYALLNE